MTWISENIGNIVVSLIIIAVVAVALYFIIKNRRNGRSFCGCGCSSCAMKEDCRYDEKHGSAKKESR